MTRGNKKRLKMHLLRGVVALGVSGLLCGWVGPDLMGFVWSKTWTAFGVFTAFLLMLFNLRVDLFEQDYGE